MEDGVRVPPDQRAHESILPWHKGWQTLKAIWPQLVYISLLTVSIPQCLVSFFQAQKALDVGSDFDFNPSLSLKVSYEIFSRFAMKNLSLAILTLLVAFWGYLTVIALVLQKKRSLPIDLPRAFIDGLKALPQALLLLLLSFMIFQGLVLLGLLIPFASFFVLIGAVLLAALPILLMVEPRRFGRALRASLSMHYVEGSGLSRWSAFFVILSFEILLMGSFSLIDLIHQKMKTLDITLHLPRELWISGSRAFPFGYLTPLFDAVTFTLEALLAFSFAVFTASFILELSYRSRLGERIEVKA